MSDQQVGRYQIERELGRGGMAVVYLAHDPNTKRQVAIKVLPRQFTFDEQFTARFQREAEVIASLEHPRIVPIYDFGEHNGQPFIVMRYMPGGALDDRLKNETLTLSDISRIVSQVAEGLDEAHRQKIVHRDIKPGNIMFDAKGDAYLSDFGIAKISESSATLTGTGNIIGTPEYMSPEQAMGNVDVDGRTDVYALGVILFQVLAKQLPYRADTPVGTLMAHITEPIPKFSDVGVEISPHCEAVIIKSIAKEREDRFPTAGEMAAMLDKVAAGETIPIGTLPARMMPAEVVTRVREMVQAQQPVIQPKVEAVKDFVGTQVPETLDNFYEDNQSAIESRFRQLAKDRIPEETQKKLINTFFSNPTRLTIGFVILLGLCGGACALSRLFN